MPRTVERLERWQSKLIDLSKRNKMINFRPTKRTSIRIIDELPTEIFKKVIVHHTPLDFLAFQSWENPDGYTSAEEIPPTEYVRQDSSDLAERYIDDFLQTGLDHETLNENLYRIYLKSRSSMEEQGYNTLFLALGILEYYESDDSRERMRVPILLLPVELKRKSVSSPFQLFLLDENFVLNPAIVLKLELDFGIKIESLPEDFEEISADNVLNSLKKVISGKKGWRVLNDIYLGIFSFNKFIMYKDLDSQHELILKHPIVAALAEGTSFSTDPSMIPDPATLDDKLSPLDTYQILDADSSQQAAILAAKSGQSFIVQGPPGTGKSQTIANIISECITAGKTVLFVSEKMAALEVVKRRLEEAGLGDFCLEMHSKKANKREIIRELDRCLKLQKVNEPGRITDLYQLEQYRKDLNEYVRMLHTPFGKLQDTPFIAHGQVATYERAPEIYFQIDKPMDFSHEDLEDKKRHLKELSVTLEKVAPFNQHPWYGCQITNLDYKTKTDIQKYLSNVKNSISEVENKIHLLAKLCAVSAPKSLDETENLIKIAELLLKSPQPEPFMLLGESWTGLSEDVRQAVNIGTEFSEGEERLSEHYTDGIYNLDLEGILSRKEEYISFSNEDLIPEVENKARLLAKLCATSVPKSLDETENLIKIAKLLLRSPQPEPFMLRGESWISLSEEVHQAVNIGTEFFEGKKRLSKYYTGEIYSLDLEGILSRKEKYGSSISKIFKPGLWYKFWKDHSALKNVSVGKTKEKLSEIISDLNLKLAIKVRDTGRWLDENDEKCRKLFRKFWNGRDTDWEKIREVVSWVNEFMTTIGTRGNNEDLIKLACDLEIDTERISDSLDELVSSLTQLKDNWRSLRGFLDFDESVFWEDFLWLKNVSAGEQKEELSEIISELKLAIKVRDFGRWLDENDDKYRKLFGKFWNGRDTDWRKIREVVSWVNEFVKTIGIGGNNEGLIKLACDPEIETERISDSLDELVSSLTQLSDNWRSLKEVLNFDESVLKEGTFESSSFQSLHEKIDSWIEGYESLVDWVDFMSAKQECEEIGLGEFLKSTFKNSVNPDEFIPVFTKGFYKQWLDKVYSQNQILKKFKGDVHEEQIKEFRELDKFQIKLARARARYILSKQLPDMEWSSSQSSELGILKREIGKKRKHKSLRKLIPEIQNLLRVIKPCFMMSPLSIAQYLPPGSIEFDVVIFDEASQICPEDAIGAISRGNQLIVAGDTKQLPPTTFFQTDIDFNAEDEEFVTEESILEECDTIGMPNLMLRWHYRSRDESLIAFSNRHIYGNNLNTFPGPGKDSGVSFEHIESGVYDRGRSRKNKIEAQYVAKKVMEHAREHPKLSLGVVAFSQPQQMAILDEIERLRRENMELEFFFDENKYEPFFVKNLETVQGDERDVIYLSVGYGKDESGHMTMNFGPLNQDGGWRRLNVAITRARERVVVFSSILPDDMDLSKTGSRGVKLLKYYLDFAIKGDASFREETESHPKMDFESPFEEAVSKALTEKGLQLEPQVGCSDFRIDLAVVDEQKPGRYILGIECDGATYHSSKTARDRDRLRQEELEKLGWQIHRVWSTDWIRNPKREIERILKAVDKAKEKARYAEIGHSGSGNQAEFEDCSFNDVDSETSNTNIQEHQELLEATSELPEGVIAYSKTPVIPVGSPEQIYKADIYKVGDVVSEIVKYEGPIHIQETARRVAEFWEMKKTGRRITEIVENAASWAARSGAIKRKGDFLWPTEMKIPPIRRCNKEEFSRPIDYVCLEEIAKTAFLVVRKEYRISKDELIKQVARILGYDRVGDNIQNRIEEGIDLLLKFKRIGHDAEGIWRLQ